MAGSFQKSRRLALACALLATVWAFHAVSQVVPPDDEDGDTISDIEEGRDLFSGPRDTDNDGTPDYQDLDSDNDTVADILEAGRGDILEPPLNHDEIPEYNDNLPDYIDIDADNDGLHDKDEAWAQGVTKPTLAEQMADPVAARALLADSEKNPWVPTSNVPNPDGILDLFDQDSDNDLIPDFIEAGRDINPFTPPIDTDGDGVPDFRDTDSDGDGTPDVQEWDSDGDLNPNFSDPNDIDGPLGDMDEDLITNLEEGANYTVSPATGYYVLQAGGRLTDSDASPDHLDADSDDDGLSDKTEKGTTSLLAPPVRSRGPSYDPDYITADIDDDGSPDGYDPGPSSLGQIAFTLGLGRLDRDYDDDGISDGLEGAGDVNGNDIIDWLELTGYDKWEADGDARWAWDDPDSDGDGLKDSVEAGLTSWLGDGPGSVLGTKLSAGNFQADSCPADTTNPYKRDTDGGGMDDGLEDLNRNGCFEPELGETDPNNFEDDSLFVDPDEDGLDTGREIQLGLNPDDADSDNDGFLDGEENGRLVVAVTLRNLTQVSQSGEASQNSDIDRDGLVNGKDLDADGDGLSDTLEGCFTEEYLLANPEKFNGPDGLLDLSSNEDGTYWYGNPEFVLAPALCNNTHFLKVDTDGGGTVDGLEDASKDGITNGFETDPLNPLDDPVVDRDLDALAEAFEVSLGISDLDLDSDDDGLSDFNEVRVHRTDPADADTDGDGIFDGTELSVTADRVQFGNPPVDGTDQLKLLFIADLDPFTSTDPLNRDTDGGGAFDGTEDFNRNGLYEPEIGETDPLNPDDDANVVDCDGDGIPDSGELAIGQDVGLTVPQSQQMALDADYDDDGLRDGLEAITDTDGDGLAGIIDPDSDNDGLTDGLEYGITGPVDPPETPPQNCAAAVGTNAFSPNFHVDVDPATTTNMLREDTDGGGKTDGQEDFNRNGQTEDSETDPNDPTDDADGEDRDGDGLRDREELILYFTNPDDPDTDDDGLSDGREVRITFTSPINHDSDSDGLQDGTEFGIDTPDFPEATDGTFFRPDLDRATTTNPKSPDTDSGGRFDGVEDGNKNGRFDPGETNPLDPSDDTDPLPEPADDADGDGLADFIENSLGLDPFDWDTDDDGIPDGLENGGINMSVTLATSTIVTVNSFQVGRDVDIDGLMNGLDPDSDGDGIRDSVEWCITEEFLLLNEADVNGADGIPDTDAGQDGTWWMDNPDFVLAPDDCLKTHFLLADTDRGGVNDGLEDSSHDGVFDPDESDPLDPADDGGFGGVDADGDGLTAQQEALLGTSDLDTDSDDDGLPDGQEVLVYLTNPKSPDSDGDGLFDGTEAGIDTPLPAVGAYGGTDVSKGFFIPDADAGATTTSPKLSDTDGGGRSDGTEDASRNGAIDSGETDPNDPADDGTLQDCDGDGIPDLVEVNLISQFSALYGINPAILAGLPGDADFDDDGIADGLESFGDTDGDNLPGILDPDSDNDGLKDGLESGVTIAVFPPFSTPPGCSAAVGTNTGSPNFVLDQNPLTTTDRLVQDTDGGGVADGAEDANQNGRVDPGETDPKNPLDDGGQSDSDGDGLSDTYELAGGLNPFDADTDDDGLTDGREALVLNTNPASRDTDSDGIQDGTERGLTVPDYAPDTNMTIFVPDLHPASKTNARVLDTDGGGRNDGLEDLNRNGRVDPGETDPLNPADDDAPLPGNTDTDGDGITDFVENLLHTSIFAVDTDADGISDFIEAGGLPTVTNGSPTYLQAPNSDTDALIDALDFDSDNDGIGDGYEDRDFDGIVDPGELNPRNPDSDSDGVPDIIEIGGPARVTAADWPDSDEDGTIDPLDVDSDNDGLLDGNEDLNSDGILDATETSRVLPDTDSDGVPDSIEAGNVDTDRDGLINAQDPDSDGDGLKDGDEDRNGNGIREGGETDPLVPDTDEGGISDGEETTKGTDPLNPADDGVRLAGCSAGASDPGLLGALLLLSAASAVRLRKRREANPTP